MGSCASSPAIAEESKQVVAVSPDQIPDTVAPAAEQLADESGGPSPATEVRCSTQTWDKQLGNCLRAGVVYWEDE